MSHLHRGGSRGEPKRQLRGNQLWLVIDTGVAAVALLLRGILLMRGISMRAAHANASPIRTRHLQQML